MSKRARRAVPDEIGPRREALRSRRSRARRRTFTAGGVAAVIAGLVAAGGIAYFASEQVTSDRPPGPLITPNEDDPVTTTLLFGTREEGGARWLSLIAYNTEEQAGALVYVPAHAAVEVPGRGLQGVGDALETGGVPLLLVSVENLLGVEVDSYIEMSDSDAQVLFEATGPISVDVPHDVKVAVGKNRARLIFEEGLQRLGAPFLVQLLYTRGLESDDVELGSRHLAFWDGLFQGFAEEPENLAAAVRAAGGALQESNEDVGQHARLLATMAGLDPSDRVLTTLPVQQVSVGGSELYSVDPEQVETFMGELVSGIASPQEDARVQVLNGNGVPGIGQEVARKLIGAGFRVVLTGNARHLNYPKTLVITYDDSPEGQQLAEEARKLIGVGEVQISGQQQGIVDLTIVIGKDFLRTR